MGYVLLMTFSGSALFVGYLCYEKILGKFMTQCMRYRALMIVMLVYAIPWVWTKGIYRSIIEFFWPETIAAGAKGIVDMADIETGAIAYQTQKYKLLTVIVSIWFAVAVMLLIVKTVKSLKKTHELHALAIKCEDENLEETLRHLRKTIHYRHEPEIVWTRVNNKTFTISAFKPIIFLQKEYAVGDLYWILKHEMTHIVSMDLWVKLLLEFVCCLYWLNPLIYLLEHKIKVLCETSCDEKVIEGCTEEECQKYIDLLERSSNGKGVRIQLNSTLENGREIDKRIILIKNRKDIRGIEKIFVICVFGVLVFLNSLTALAYPEVHHVKSEIINVAEDSVDGGNFWIYDYAADGYGVPTDVVLYNEQFVDQDGEIYPIDSANELEACSEHGIVAGFVQIHEKNGEDGCVIETYEGTRCTKCGNVWKGGFFYKTRTVPCTH